MNTVSVTFIREFHKVSDVCLLWELTQEETHQLAAPVAVPCVKEERALHLRLKRGKLNHLLLSWTNSFLCTYGHTLPLIPSHISTGYKQLSAVLQEAVPHVCLLRGPMEMHEMCEGMFFLV